MEDKKCSDTCTLGIERIWEACTHSRNPTLTVDGDIATDDCPFVQLAVQLAAKDADIARLVTRLFDLEGGIGAIQRRCLALMAPAIQEEVDDSLGEDVKKDVNKTRQEAGPVSDADSTPSILSDVDEETGLVAQYDMVETQFCRTIRAAFGGEYPEGYLELIGDSGATHVCLRIPFEQIEIVMDEAKKRSSP